MNCKKVSGRKAGKQKAMAWLVIFAMMFGSLGMGLPLTVQAEEQGIEMSVRAELKAKIAEAELLKQESYTEESWLALQGALLAAQSVLQNADETNIENALNILVLTIGQLEPRTSEDEIPDNPVPAKHEGLIPAMFGISSTPTGSAIGVNVTSGSAVVYAGSYYPAPADLGDGGPAEDAYFGGSSDIGMAFDSKGNLYIADKNAHRIRIIPSEYIAAADNMYTGQAMNAGYIYTIIGSTVRTANTDISSGGQTIAGSQLRSPSSVALDRDDNLYILDGLGPRSILMVAAETGPLFGEEREKGQIYRLAGTSIGGNANSGNNGPAKDAKFNTITQIAFDSNNNLFIADRGNYWVRMIAAQTGTYYGSEKTAGYLYLFAGTGTRGTSNTVSYEGTATGIDLAFVQGVALDADGNLYISEGTNTGEGPQTIRQVTPGGMMTTIAGINTSGYAGDGGPAGQAVLANPYNLAFDKDGNLYVAERSNYTIRMIRAVGGKITKNSPIYTVAGGNGDGTMNEGIATASTMGTNNYCAIDGNNNLYIPQTGKIFCVGNPSEAPALANLTIVKKGADNIAFAGIQELSLDSLAEFTAQDDSGKSYPLTSHKITWTVAGNPADIVSRPNTSTIAIKGLGTITFTIQVNGVVSEPLSVDVVEKVAPVLKSLTLSGNPSLVYSSSGQPYDLKTLDLKGTDDLGADYPLDAQDITWEVKFGSASISADGMLTLTGEGAAGVTASVGDIFSNTLIVTKEKAGIITTIAGSGTPGDPIEGDPALLSRLSANEVKLDQYGNLYIISGTGVWTVPATDNVEGYFGLTDLKAGHIYRIAGGNGAGYEGNGGPAREAKMTSPVSLAFDSKNNLYVADHYGGNGVRRVDVQTGVITSVFGDGIKREQRYFQRHPDAIRGINDTGPNCMECHIKPDTPLDEFAGNGKPGVEGEANQVDGVAIDKDDNIFISEHYFNWVRAIPARDYADFYGLKNVKAGHIYRIAGDGGQYTGVLFDHDNKKTILADYQGDGGPATKTFITFSQGAAFDSEGSMYVTDTPRGRLRKVDKNGIIKTLNPSNDQRDVSDPDGKPLSETRVFTPNGIIIDRFDNLYFSESENSKIRMVPAKSGVYHGIEMEAGHAYTIVGGNGLGNAGDGGLATAAQIGKPQRLFIDKGGNLYFDVAQTIRMVETPPFLAGLSLDAGPSAPDRSMTWEGKALIYDLKRLTLSATDQTGFGFDISDRPITWKVVSGPATVSGKGILTITGRGTVEVAASAYGDQGLFSNTLRFDVTRADRDDDDGGSGTSSTSPTSPVPTPPSTPTAPSLGGDNTSYNKALLESLTKATEAEKAKAQLPASASSVSPTDGAPVTLTANDGLGITIPPAALRSFSGPVSLTVGLGSITQAPQAGPSVVVLNPIAYQRQFGLAGQTDQTVNFDAPVILSFPLNLEDLPQGVTPQQLAIYWWNPDRGDWTKIGGVYDSSTNTISAPTYHFSTYAVMADTKTVPDRLAGQDRYDTANAVAAQGWEAGAAHVVIVNGQAYADALSATPLAFKLKAPVLLTEAKGLTPSTLDQLKKLAPQKITLIGGTGVISQGIEESLAEVYGKGNVVRYGGTDRFDTAAQVAKLLGSTGKAVLANGEQGHYTDALAISSYAAYNGLPILFTRSSDLPEVTRQVLKDQKVSATLVVGGTAVVPERIFGQLPGAVRYGGRNLYETATQIAEGLEFNLSNVYVATGLGFTDALVASNLAAYTLSPLVLVDREMPAATAEFFTTNKDGIQHLILVGGEGVISKGQEAELKKTINK